MEALNVEVVKDFIYSVEIVARELSFDQLFLLL
jgi:hypothetical protein